MAAKNSEVVKLKKARKEIRALREKIDVLEMLVDHYRKKQHELNELITQALKKK